MANKIKNSKFIATPRHAIFFFFIYITGAVLLTFEKTIIASLIDANFPNSAFADILIILTAVILMGTYVVCVVAVPATKLRTDVAADNVYYLGFLYTLTSLSVALIIDDATAILGNFGVAIISTLIGIAARVGLNQLRVDPTDIEEASRLELSDATRRVRAELDETVFQLASFREMSMQVMAEGYEEVQKKVDGIADRLFSSLEDTVDRSTKPLDELVENSKKANEKAVNSLAELTNSNVQLIKSNKSMAAEIEKVNVVLRTLSEHYADTGIIDDKVIASVQEQLENIQTNLTREAREEFGGLSRSVDEMKASSKKLEGLLSATEKAIGVPEADRVDEKRMRVNAPPPQNTRNFSAPSVLETYRDKQIMTYPNRQGVFVDKLNYPDRPSAKIAIERMVAEKRQQKPKNE